MAKPPKIKTVRTFCTSNVGADEDTKTLWILGAGGSRHLGFPLSFDFFQKSIGLCTAQMKEFADENDLGYKFFQDHFSKRKEPVPTCNEIKTFKSDPELALRNLHTWGYLEPEHAVMVKLQFLYRNWQSLPKLLTDIGLKITPHELLSTYPEKVIDDVRNLSAASLVKDHGFYDQDAARRKLEETLRVLGEIYFYTLSHFNEAARDIQPSENLYRSLVRSFILEKNARIMSFNYDTMLDEAVFHGFTRTWHYGGMTISGINGYPVAKGQDGDLILIKPHGSLHFLICQSCKRAYVNWFWTYRRTGANSAASDNRRCAFCKKPQPGRKEMLSSLTVAPLYDKKIIKRSFQAITRTFAWAENVVSVGYSFPEQDTYFFNCMKQGIELRKGTPLRVRVVSHSHDSAKDIKKRLEKELVSRGVPRAAMKVTAEKLNGFEEVRCGFENIPVKT